MGGVMQSPTLSVCRASLISFAKLCRSFPSRSASTNRTRRPRFCCFSRLFAASFTLLISNLQHHLSDLEGTGIPTLEDYPWRSSELAALRCALQDALPRLN